MKELYIIDAVGFLFRSYYAIAPITNPSGNSTNALYGFIRSVQKLRKSFDPKHMVAVFDGPDNKKSRQAIYSEYKMNRKGAPEDLFPQFELAFNYCKLAGIPVISAPGVEADDAMASIAVWAAKQNASVYLCTSDKDLYQLVDDQIKVIHVHKDNQIIDAKAVEEKFGVPPSQMLDLLAIMGDKSDNIPGLDGFGPKTAASLLQKFGSLDKILANPDKVPGKKKQETIIEQKNQALMSKELATLQMNIEFPEEKTFFEIDFPKDEELKELYKEMNFRSLLKEIGEPSLDQPDEKKDSIKTQYQIIDNEKDLCDLVQKLKRSKEICVDVETTGLDPILAKIVGIGFCVEPGIAWYVPFNFELGNTALLLLKELFDSPGISFYGHNLKYDFLVLYNSGLVIKKICFDTMLASYILRPDSRRHNLDILTLEKFDHKKIEIEELIGPKRKQISMLEVELEKIGQYCSEDVDYTCRLKALFEKDLKEKKLDKLLFEIELPLLPILAKMEQNGIYLNREKLDSMSKSLATTLKELESQIYDEVGIEFNIKSPKQLSEVLYDRLGLKPPARKKTEYATGAAVLETLVDSSPVVSKVLQYRGLEKLRSTYVDALPELINPKTSRIHCTFNQSVTATGRLSCQNPNLQNIPVRSEEGRKIREGFQPQHEGWSYLSADYSQIELRLLAHFCEDPALLSAFTNHMDIHRYTASLIFEIPVEEVTKEMRHQAKTVNFGILYGQGAYGLSQELGISNKQAAQFIQLYFERFPKISDYLEKSRQSVRDTGHAYTLFGRHRPIPEIHNKNPHIKAAALRLAINTPLQGTQADLIKKAMIAIDKDIQKKKLQGFMILQIHDELIFEIPDTEISIFKELVKTHMEGVIELKVPLVVNTAIGKNWGEC